MRIWQLHARFHPDKNKNESQSKKYFFPKPTFKRIGWGKTPIETPRNMPITRSQSIQECILDKDALEASKPPRKRGSCSETARSCNTAQGRLFLAKDWKLIEPGHYTSLTVARKNARLIRTISRCVSAEHTLCHHAAQNNQHGKNWANIQ